MGYNKYNGRKMALGGIMAAVSIVLMLLSAVVPTMSYGLPALCGVLTTLVVIECGDRAALLMYGAVSILSLLLLPAKESAVVYLLVFGWYPVAKRRIESINKPVLEWGLKLAAVAIPVAVGSAVAIAMFGLEALFGEDIAGWMIPLLYIAAAAVFVVYDIALTRLISAYLNAIRPKILPRWFR